MTDDALRADRATLEGLLGPAEASGDGALRWTDARLRGDPRDRAGAAYDPGRHEEVVYRRDPATGLRAIVAVHSTALGPSLGGTRWYPYADAGEALRDVLRLSSAMTAKAAAAGLDLGGGKAAVIGDPAGRTREQLAAYAALVERLEGRYVTTTDVGTTTADVDALMEWTSHVVGASPERGGSGDTSELTGATVMHGMRAALRAAFGDGSLAGRRVAVVGVGKVGVRVARAAAEDGASVAVADIRRDAAEALAAELGADLLEADEAYEAPCDVLSPNALGGVLNPDSIPRLRCRVVCGAANNQLLRDPEDAALLAGRGILYAPDYVVSAGGVINVAVERDGYDPERARAVAAGVHDAVLDILATAERLGVSTAEAALRRVEDRLAAARGR